MEKEKLLDEFDSLNLDHANPMDDHSASIQPESDSDTEDESDIPIMDKNLSVVSSPFKLLLPF